MLATSGLVRLTPLLLPRRTRTILLLLSCVLDTLVDGPLARGLLYGRLPLEAALNVGMAVEIPLLRCNVGHVPGHGRGALERLALRDLDLHSRTPGGGQNHDQRRQRSSQESPQTRAPIHAQGSLMSIRDA